MTPEQDARATDTQRGLVQRLEELRARRADGHAIPRGALDAEATRWQLVHQELGEELARAPSLASMTPEQRREFTEWRITVARGRILHRTLGELLEEYRLHGWDG